MYNHILITTDGSELAAKGVDHGLALAKALDAKVSVLTVTEPLPAAAIAAAARGGVRDPLQEYERQMDDEVAKIGASVQQKAAELGVAAELIRETDSYPAEAIVRTAKLRGCDLIVMASHGRRGVSRLLLGSQTAEVLTHTTIPVHVIR